MSVGTLAQLRTVLAAIVAAGEELALGESEEAAAILANAEAELAAVIEGAAS